MEKNNTKNRKYKNYSWCQLNFNVRLSTMATSVCGKDTETCLFVLDIYAAKSNIRNCVLKVVDKV